ncbi:MAG TPA: phosphatidate cytidylyltransferase [Solirubrobacteraceae bacterium]
MASSQLNRRPSSQRPRRPSPVVRARRRSELRGRIVVAVPAIAAAAVIVYEGGLLFAAALLVLGCLCLHELYRITARAHPARLAGFAALLALLIAAHYGTRDQVLLVGVAALPVAFMLSIAAPRASLAGVTITLLGVWWIGLALAHAVLLRSLPHGGGILTDVLVGTFVGDTGAYIGGRSFGRRPLAPALSPSKTIEGLVIGIVCAIVSVWFASLYQPWLPKGDAVLIGVGVAIAAPLGDLFESFVKRQAGVKDSGRVFGAHGGALDRLDAVLFSAVVSYYVWLAILGAR